MKKIILILFVWGINSFILFSQKILSLPEVLQAALRQNYSYRISQMEFRQETYQQKELCAGWWPEIYLAYEYRYQPIIPTTIIPVGQFNLENPTDEMRGIKMGSRWQQNGGINLSQPLLNWSVIRNIKQAKIKSLLADNQIKIQKTDLIYEASHTFFNICRKEAYLKIVQKDTLTTYNVLKEQWLRYENEMLLLSDLNRARINHNDALVQWQSVLTDLITEKIYLSYLTGFSIDSLLYNTEFQEQSIDKIYHLLSFQPSVDSIHEITKQELEMRLAAQNLAVAKAKSLPSLSLNGYLGFNQYSDEFLPFEQGSWFGNAYIAISLQIPILIQENRALRNKRLKLNEKIFQTRKIQEQEKYVTEAMMSWQKINNLSQELQKLQSNTLLQRDVLDVLNKRFKENKANAFELNFEELSYLKQQAILQEKLILQITYCLDYLKNSGLLYLLLSDYDSN